MNKLSLFQLILAVLLCHLNLNAQEQALSERLKYKNVSFGDFIKGNSEAVYTFGPGPYYYNDKDYTLRKYRGNDFTLLEEREYENFDYEGIDPKDISYSSSLRLGKKTHLFFEARDNETGIIYLLKRELQDDLSLGPIIKIASANYDDRGFGVFEIFISRDSSKIAVYAGKESLKLDFIPTVSVFDQDFKQLWQQPLAVRAAENFVAAISLSVSNRGEVFLLTLNKDEKIKRELASDNYQLYRLSQGGIEALYDLSQLGVVVHFGKLYCDVDGKLLFFGLCGNDEDQALGSAFLSFDLQSHQLISSKLESLGQKQQESMAQRSRSVISIYSTQGRGFHRLKFGDLYQWGNGQYTILAEHYYYHGQSQSGPEAGEAWEIHAYTVDSAGNTISSVVLPKKNPIAPYDYASSHGYLAQKLGDELFVLYNFPQKELPQLISGELRFEDLNLIASPGLIQARISPTMGAVSYRSFINQEHQDKLTKGSFLDLNEYIKIGSNSYFGEISKISNIWFFRFELSAN